MMGQQQEIVAGSKTLLRRIVLAFLVAALMAAMALGGAGSAQAKVAAHCTGDGISFSDCAGGSGEQGGGGGGKVFTTNGTSTGGGSIFRGTGSGGGGRDFVTNFITGPQPCTSGKDAQR